MIENIGEHIQVLDWQSARDFIHKSDKVLFKIIDDISPDKKFKFIKMRYPYGTTILDNDVLFVPDKSFSTTPITFSDIPEKIKTELAYRNIPFGIITENTLEILKEYPDKVFSVYLSGPDKGIELGIFEYFGLTNGFSVTAGARSVYMVPKISEARYHKKIMKNYALTCYQPKNIFKHHHIFKSLYASGSLKTKWETEIIFLGGKWDKMVDDESPAWRNFKNYLNTKCLDHSGFGREQVILNVVWENMASAIQEEGIRPDPYTIDTLKHLIYVFVGALSGSRPSTNDYVGPLTEIQEIYVDTYGLDHIPTIMRPYNFSLQENIPVYYSMQHPMLLSSTPNLRKMDTNIQEIISLIGIKDFLISKLAAVGNIKLNYYYLADTLRKMKFDYFHSDMYSRGKNIRPTKEIPETDKDFLFSPTKNKELIFAKNGDFIKGCVKISKAT